MEVLLTYNVITKNFFIGFRVLIIIYQLSFITASRDTNWKGIISRSCALAKTWIFMSCAKANTCISASCAKANTYIATYCAKANTYIATCCAKANLCKVAAVRVVGKLVSYLNDEEKSNQIFSA